MLPSHKVSRSRNAVDPRRPKLARNTGARRTNLLSGRLAMASPVERVRNAIQMSARGHGPALRPACEVAITPARRTPPLQAVWIARARDCAGGCGNNNCQTEADQRSQDYAAHSNLPPTRRASHLFAIAQIHRSSRKLLSTGCRTLCPPGTFTDRRSRRQLPNRPAPAHRHCRSIEPTQRLCCFSSPPSASARRSRTSVETRPSAPSTRRAASGCR
jgi:hypothetical protein